MVSVKEVKNILSYGVGGLLAASLYQIMNIMWKKRIGIGLSSITTEALHQDGVLCSLFVELEDTVKEFDPIALVRAMDAADQLVFLRFKLEYGGLVPMLEDRVKAYLTFTRCEDSLKRLLNCIEASSITPRDVVCVQRVLSRISESLAIHLSAIMTLTTDK
jgi:hypothetical protein